MTNASPWISVGDLAQAFAPDNNTLPPSSDLADQTLHLYFEKGGVIEHRFETDRKLIWNVTAGPEQGLSAEETYLATRLCEGIYFVDFIKHLGRATSVSLVLDLQRGIFTAVVGQMPDEAEAKQALLSRVAAGQELTSVTAAILNGSINTPFNAETPRHSVTAELVGRRAEYTYSPTEQYEHIYLNENLYTWQCLRGAEKGLADTDRCHYYKLADNLYLFIWREKIVPTLGVVTLDYDSMRSSGKIFGYQGDNFDKLSNFSMGARIRLLNITQRD